MKITLKSKQTSAILGVLSLVAIVTLAPHAFAKQGPSSAGQGQQGGIPLGPPYNPQSVDPNAIYAWSAGLVVVAIMTGVGIWSAVRKH